MRAASYGFGSVVIFTGALALALLPAYTPSVWLFAVGGGLLTLAITVGSVMVSATAGSWPRLHMGPLLAAGGAIGVLVCLWQTRWLESGWSGLVLLAGLGFSLSMRRSERRRTEPPGPVKPPFGR